MSTIPTPLSEEGLVPPAATDTVSNVAVAAPAPAAGANPIELFANLGLSILSDVSTGKVQADVGVAKKIEALVIAAVPLIAAPTMAGITALLSGAAQLLEGVSGGEVAADAKLAEAMLKIVNAGVAAVTAQAGKPIDPSLVPQLSPVS